LQSLGDRGELAECRLQVLDDLADDDIGWEQIVGVVEAGILQAGDVEVGLVAGDQLVVGEGAEALGLNALVPVLAG
jgi:hypothetical protein